MSNYELPIDDVEFLLNHVIHFDEHCEQINMADLKMDLASAVIKEASKFGTNVLAPLNATGDSEGATLNENNVTTAAGFSNAYTEFSDGGWGSLTCDEQYGGQGLPQALGVVMEEVWQSANLSFALCPMLTQGAINAVHKHGDQALKDMFLENLISGKWTGTMNLTEPNAGSDLGKVRTKAVPEGDHYLISGQKIFITWGEHDMAENIIHLVLARLPDAPEGVKGISLFVVPKVLIDEDGELTKQNDVVCTSIEHKLGIHASPTCSMSFGENGGAVGYLVGEPNKGLSYMFTMMNHARLNVGIQGLAVSERSYQQALTYAKERLQGSANGQDPVAIINHSDVKRMLLLMKSGTEAMRGFVYLASAEVDKSHVDGASQKAANDRVELFTPIVKGWLTELSQEITYLGTQVHGGMGFIEETGSAQHYRDARILTIYEGTTGIQGLDLIGRKTIANGGEHITMLLNEIEQYSETLLNDKASKWMGEALSNAISSVRNTVDWVLTNSGSKEAIGGAAVNYMMQVGFLIGGWIMSRSSVEASKLLLESVGSDDFLMGKTSTCKFYFDNYLPRVEALEKVIRSGNDSLFELSESQF